MQPFPHPSDATHKIWPKLANWHRRAFKFESVDDDDGRRTTDGLRTIGILEAHHVSLRLRWANELLRLLVSYDATFRAARQTSISLLCSEQSFFQPSECKYVLCVYLSVRLQVSFIPLWPGIFFPHSWSIEGTSSYATHATSFAEKNQNYFSRTLPTAKIKIRETAKIWRRENILLYGIYFSCIKTFPFFQICRNAALAHNSNVPPHMCYCKITRQNR